jgi:hypothetical protein
MSKGFIASEVNSEPEQAREPARDSWFYYDYLLLLLLLLLLLIRLHNEELHSFYASSNIIRAIKSMRVRLVEYVARMGEVRNGYKLSVGNHRRRHHTEDLGVGGKIILEWILEK